MYIKKEKLDSISSDIASSPEHFSSGEEAGYSPEARYCPENFHPHPPHHHQQYHHIQYDVSNTRVKRLRANDRERRRVHLINCAMDTLRSIVPGLKNKKKLTKLELLREAYHYIWTLDESLRTGKSLDQIKTRPPLEARSLPVPVYCVRYDAMPILRREIR